MNGQNNNNNGNNGSKLPPVAPKGMPPIQPTGMGRPVQPTQPVQPNQQMKPIQPAQASVPVAASKKPEKQAAKPKKEKNKQPKRKSRFLIIMLLLIILIAGLGIGLFVVLNNDEQEIEYNSTFDTEYVPVDTAYVYKVDGSFMDIPADEVDSFLDGQKNVLDEDRWYNEPMLYLYKPYEADENGDGSTYFADYDNKRMLAAVNNESEGLINQGWYQYECVYVKYYDASLDSTVVEILPIGRFDSNIHTAITEKEYNEIKDGGGDVVVKENCTHCGSDEHTTEEHICEKCGETGHGEKTCTAKICLLCNEKGHTAEEHVCERCGGKGHLKEKCPAPSCSICNTVGHSDAEHPCTKCGGKGHDASTCKDKCTICNQTGHDAKNHPCTKCGGKGHDASACTVKICGICKAQGHVAGEHPCTKCGGKGHDASACTVKICAICNAQGHVATEHECTKCGATGHDASTCENMCTICNQTGHDAENHICTKCNKKGHAEKDCTAKICTICKGLGKDGVGHLFTEHLCTNCNKNGHDASACTVKKCNSCTEQFTSQDALDKHVAEKHTKCADCQKTGHASGTCCSICGDGTTSHDDSGHPCTNCNGTGHAEKDCPVKKCNYCPETFNSEADLKKHMNVRHTTCADCGKTGHESGKCCKICGNGTTSHDDSGHPCTNCNGTGHDASTCYKCKVEGCTERFNSEADLKKHMNVRHTTCADCGKTGHASGTCCSICGDGTTAHDDGGHPCTKCGDYGHDGSSCPNRICSSCQEEFRSEDDLNKHKTEKHTECEDCKQTGHVSGTCCSICGNGTTSHDDSEHPCTNCNGTGHDASTCYKCKVEGCTERFNSEADLMEHMNVRHTTCADCGKTGHESGKCCSFCGDGTTEHDDSGHPCDNCKGTGHLYEYCPGCTKCGNRYHTAKNCGAPYCALCAEIDFPNKNDHSTEQHKCSNENCTEYGHEIKVNESSCPQPWGKKV